jgi:putative glutamine amidotransferase
VWHQRADVLPAQYAEAVVACGGVPVLLPPVGVEGAADVAVARLDGLVISGGADVDPAQYDADPHPRTANWRPDRDAWELALLTAADAVALPVLGVCRGMQVMAVHAGGSLDQHTPDLVGNDEHSPGGDVFGSVAVTTEAGSRLASLVGDSLTVNCHHHQSVAAHPGFVATAHAEDGTLEAMETTDDDRFCVGVQWHPETAADVGLLAGLVRAAAAYRTS